MNKKENMKIKLEVIFNNNQNHKIKFKYFKCKSVKSNKVYKTFKNRKMIIQNKYSKLISNSII